MRTLLLVLRLHVAFGLKAKDPNRPASCGWVRKMMRCVCEVGSQSARHRVKVVSVAALSDDDGDEAAAEVAGTPQLDRWRRLAVAAAKQSLR